MSTPAQISASYVTAWENGDYDALGALLSETVDFVGALGLASGKKDVLDGLKGLGEVLTRIEVHARVADETDVITWFDLHTSVAAPTPTANWTRIENGKIEAIRVTFDPRELIAGLDRAQGRPQ